MSETLDPQLVAELFGETPRGYLDHAAVATVPLAVETAVAGVARALTQGTRGSAAWHELTDPAEALLAADFGVAASQITVLANTGTAFNSIARAIPFNEGDEVIIFADDFPSPRMPWPSVPGMRITELAPGLGSTRTADLVAAIGPATRAVAVTHVHATTGETVDLAAVHAACLEHDALLLVDGAQAAGLLPEVAVHADAYVGASYKWMLAGFGAAAVATNKRFDAQAVPGLVGYMNAPPSPRLAIGHSNLFGLAAFAAAAQVRQQLGRRAIYEHTTSHRERIEREAATLGYLPDAVPRAAGIVSLRASEPEQLVAALKERGFSVTTRDDRVRVSPSVTTTSADVDGLLTALEELSPTHRAGGADASKGE